MIFMVNDNVSIKKKAFIHKKPPAKAILHTYIPASAPRLNIGRTFVLISLA